MNAGQMLKNDFQINTDLKFPAFFRRFTKHLHFGFKKPLFRLSEKKIKEHRLKNGTRNSNALCIEISSEKINMLLEKRLICAADIHCLDNNSKQCLKKLCLKTCLYSSQPYLSVPQLVDNANLTCLTFQQENA